MTFGVEYFKGEGLDQEDIVVLKGGMNTLLESVKTKFYELQNETLTTLDTFVEPEDLEKGELSTLSRRANNANDAKNILKNGIKDTTKKNALVVGSLFNSRLAVYGMAKQARLRKITRLTIDTQLDSRRCPVCATMHGKTFETETILAQASTVLRGDTGTAKQLSPFIPATKESTNLLSRMSGTDLVASNYIAPPYHPMCRCVVMEETVAEHLPSLETKQEVVEKTVLQTPIFKKAVANIKKGKTSTPYLKPIAKNGEDKVTKKMWNDLGLEPTQSVTQQTAKTLDDSGEVVKIFTIDNSFKEPLAKTSVFGSGIMVTKIERVAGENNDFSYEGGYLKADAKVMTHSELVELAKNELKNSKRRLNYALSKVEGGSAEYLKLISEHKAYTEIILSDLGKFALYLGVDAILVGFAGDLIITNPTAIKPIKGSYSA
jgi:hypothetical protein